MEKEWDDRLNNEEYKNWLKVGQALIQSKEALHDFVEDKIKVIHADISKSTGSSHCDGTCKTNKGNVPSCGSCTNWVKEIKKYNKGPLNWKNTEPKLWHSTPWEIAKCFMNAQGSKTTAAANTGPDKTDLSGILNVLVNCKEFGRVYLKEKKLPEKVREIRNKVMHSATMTFPAEDMKSYVGCIIELLEDEFELKELDICKEKVQMIKSLRDGKFEIKAEGDCIESILKTLELLVESEGDIDQETCMSLETLSKLIKSNKDLESKFDSKLSKITEDFERRMDSVEVTCGELKGTVECLKTRVLELEKNSTSRTQGAASAVVQGEKFLLKNSLQCYAQKKGFELPKYTHEKNESGKFISTVSVTGKMFRSEVPKSSKKEADQSAAEKALKYFSDEAPDDHEKKTSPPRNVPLEKKAIAVPKEKGEKNFSYKNKLQEHAQKQELLLPMYDTKKTENGLFLSKVFFNGVWYTPDTLPRPKKIDAEQNAAQFVLAYLETPETVIDGGKCNTSSSKPLFDSFICSDDSTTTTKEAPRTPLNKTYKSILNEYMQRNSKESPDYRIDDAGDGKFTCSVTVLGNMYRSPSPAGSKKEAKESAAREACIQLKLSPSPKKQQDASAVPTMYLSDTYTEPCVELSNDSLLGTAEVTRDNLQLESLKCGSNTIGLETLPQDASHVKVCGDISKTYRSKLNEFVQSASCANNKPPEYHDISDEHGFLCEVIVMNKKYKSTSPQKSRKDARENAAKQAWDSLVLNYSSCGEYSAVPFSCPSEAAHSLEETDGGVCRSQVLEEASAELIQDEMIVGDVTDQAGRMKSDNYKGFLFEHLKRSKITPCFVTKKEKREFISKVFIGKRCFKGKGATRKIDAEQIVARVALGILRNENKPADLKCKKVLKDYQEKLQVDPMFPKYDKATHPEEGKFSVVVSVAKMWKVSSSEPHPKKKDVEEALAERALKLLEEENKFVDKAGCTNFRSKLNQFCQRQNNVPGSKYNIGAKAPFSGDVCFYTLEEYESLIPQASEDVATASAAMSACNGLDLI